MYYQNRFDSHVHSDCSPDGRDSVMCLCEQAIRRGFSGFAVTDYCDVENFKEKQSAVRVRESVYSVFKARAAFENKLIIASGIEFSQPLADAERAEKITSRYPFDVVLCSVKAFPDGSRLVDKNFNQYSSEEIVALLSEYYEYVFKTISWGGFDVLAHLTYPMRYLHQKAEQPFSVHSCDDIIQECLRKLVENGQALEINTAGLRSELQLIIPSSRYLKRFRELGGEFITIGSGCHSTACFGADITDGMFAAAEAGFTFFTFYKNRQPKLLKII